MNSEFLAARPDVIVQVAVGFVEQERGLELQINFPESTLATMLPIVIVIEAMIVLEREANREKPETEVSKPLNDLSTEIFSAKLEARVSDPLSVLRIEFFAARLEPIVTEPFRVWKLSQLGVSISLDASTVVKVTAPLTGAPATVTSNQISNTRK